MVEKKKNSNDCSKSGNLFIIIGLLLSAAALLLIGYNLWDDYQAGKSAEQAFLMVSHAIEAEDEHEDIVKESDEEDDISPSENAVEQPMTVKMINGQEYIGIIEIPALDLRLPIISEWSDERLKIAPCRYVGAVDTGDLIISGHSYKNHFRYIRKLGLGDTVIFTDMDGNRFEYEITGTEVIAETNVEQMESGEWDLTLFTCTPNGNARHTVRCVLRDERGIIE